MSVLVADIYADPWAETTLTGVARLVGQPTNPRTETIGSVTASQYWVRFAFTEINVLAWVNADNIRTLGDYDQVNVNLFGGSAFYTPLSGQCGFRVGTTAAMGTAYSTYLPVSCMSTYRRIAGLGIYLGAAPDFLLATYCRVQLLAFRSTNPAGSADEIALGLFTVTATNRTRYESVLGAPIAVDESYSYMLRVYGTLYSILDGTAYYLYVFHPFLLFEPES